MNILVTGGAGYIGSHVVRELRNSSHEVLVLDNLSRGHREAVSDSRFVAGDLADCKLVKRLIRDHEIEGVIHLAAHSLVGESMEKPGKYYTNNVCGGVQLLEAMVECGVRYLVFSSSAAVYGEPEEVPITENHPTQPENTYGETKLIFETIMRRYEQIHDLRFISLRYFNAAGADPSGDIGEAHDPETHLIPIVCERALGERDELYIFGDDYPTRDGTCIRDYIHVSDLARAHLLAIEKIYGGGGSRIYNLGNGEGYSVREVIEAARRVTGRDIECEIGEKRPGDPAVLVAGAERIQKDLGWRPQYSDLEDIIATAWKWHKRGGFDGKEA